MSVTLDRPQTQTPLMRRAYDLGEIAQLGPYSVATLRRLIDAGELQAVRVRNRYIVNRSEVARLLGEPQREDAL